MGPEGVLRALAGLVAGGVLMGSAAGMPGSQEPVTTASGLAGLLERVRARHGLPAVGAVVVRKGKPDVIAVTGVRRLGAPKKATAADRWHIGSCTKSMTSALAALLVGEGKIAWDRTIGQAFPDLADSMKPGWREVTLVQLLSHRAGMSPETYPAGRNWWALRAPLDRQRIDYARASLSAEPDSPPGEKFAYSNRGYIVAGAMLERAAGKPWEALIRERLWKPLGMTASGFGPPGSREKTDQPWAHRRVGERWEAVAPGPAADNAAVIGPAGTAHCSLGDLGRYIAWVLRAASGDPPPLTRATAERLFKPPAGGDYALGWGLAERSWAGGTALTHGGSNTMNYCVLWIAPKRGFGIGLVTNAGGDISAGALDEIASQLVGALAAERDDQRR